VAKAQIRAVLPEGLKESISKVRSCVAYIIAAIGHWSISSFVVRKWFLKI